MMESLVKLAKYRYECGTYSVSTSYLYFYMLVMPPTDKVTEKSPLDRRKNQKINVLSSLSELLERSLGKTGV